MAISIQSVVYVLYTALRFVRQTSKFKAPIPLQSNSSSSSTTTQMSTETTSSSQATKQKPRTSWYQSATHVTLDIYAKNVIKDESQVNFTGSTLSVRLKQPHTPDDYIDTTNLAELIDPEKSYWNVGRMKVEICMKKIKIGRTWKSLDSQVTVLSAAVEAGANSRKQMDANNARQKKWDSIAEKELKDYDEDDSSMALFRTIYKDADEDTRRAMMKSYTESGGQVLSTNWDEVKKKKVVYEGKD